MSAEVILDEHSGMYKADGYFYPRVTSILAAAGLSDFSAVPEDRLEYACERGTFVHSALAMHDLGTLDESALDPVLAPYLYAWKRFLREMEFVPELIEEPVYNPVDKYAGTLDRTGNARGCSSILLDIKTGASKEADRVQLPAYRACMLVKDPPVAIRAMWIVYLRPESSAQYRIDVIPAEYWQRLYGVFRAAITIHNFKQGVMV